MGKSNTKPAEPTIGTPESTAAMMAVNPIGTSAWMGIMAESQKFLTDRLKQDLDTQQAMLACKTPADVLQVQTEFFKTAMEQYSEEATRLFKMMSDAGQDVIEDVQTGHSRKYDDVPL